MDNKVFLFKGSIKDFMPIFAIKMATNQHAMMELLKHKINGEFTPNALYKSVLNGLMDNKMLSNYKIAYTFLYQAQFDEEMKRIVTDIWNMAFKNLINESIKIQRKIRQSQKRELDLAEFGELYENHYSANLIDILCICGCISSTIEIKCNNLIKVSIFGSYFELFANDCDIDKEFSRFFDIPNTVLYRKYLISKLYIDEENYKQSHYKKENDANGIRFDIHYFMEDKFLKTMVRLGINPYYFKNKIKEPTFPILEEDRMHSIQDRLIINQQEKSIALKSVALLQKLLISFLKMNEAERHPVALPVQEREKEKKPIENTQFNYEEIKRKNDMLIQRSHEQEQTIKILQEKLKKESELKENALREVSVLEHLIYDMNYEEAADVVLDETVINKLRESKGVIIGGHQHYLNKLKQYLPLWTIIDTNNVSKGNWAAIKEAEVVLIQTRYLSHNVYYLTMNTIEDKSKVIFNKRNNIMYILNEVYRKLAE